jgi:hypothetical protein
MYNNFENLPTVPYKLINYLAEHNDRLFKLLKYPSSDALDKPNLTFEEKLELLYTDVDNEVDKHIFLKPLVGDEMTNAESQIRIYKSSIKPLSKQDAVVSYRFDFITGDKISLVYDDGIPCPRLDLLETEILNTFNGVDLFGTGEFQFSRDLDTTDKQIFAMSNSKGFFGTYLIMSVRWVDVSTKGCS